MVMMMVVTGTLITGTSTRGIIAMSKGGREEDVRNEDNSMVVRKTQKEFSLTLISQRLFIVQRTRSIDNKLNSKANRRAISFQG